MDTSIFLNAEAVSYGAVNILDIIVLVVLGLCIFSGYRKGLLRSLFNLLSTIISIFIAKAIYPVVSVFLRDKSGIYVNIKNNIIEKMNLGSVVRETTLNAQEQFIESLPIPDFLADKLLENNNTEIYSILDVSTVEEYVGGYIANIFINILSAVLVFLLVLIIMKIIANALDIVTKLPVLKQFNKTGGIIAGIISGLVYIWIGLIIYTLFFVKPESGSMELLYSSRIALFLYNNNFLMYALLRIFA